MQHMPIMLWKNTKMSPFCLFVLFPHSVLFYWSLERSMTTYGRLPLPFTVRKAWRGWIPATRGSSGATCTPLGRPVMTTTATAIFRDLAYSCFSLTSLVCSRALLIGNMYQSSLVTVTISGKETLNWFLSLQCTINTCYVNVFRMTYKYLRGHVLQTLKKQHFIKQYDKKKAHFRQISKLFI